TGRRKNTRTPSLGTRSARSRGSPAGPRRSSRAVGQVRTVPVGDTDFDAIIVGAGHNGLVAATLLAQAGYRVLVLERSGQVGGATVSGSPFPGVDARLSRYSYLVSLFPRELLAHLGVDVELRRRRV